MNINYFEPLNKAWQRMVNALFRPFDIKKWFIVGFTAFLADLLDDGSKGGGYNFRDDDIESLHNLPDLIFNWLVENPVWAVLIGIGIIVLLIILVVLIWLSSRGKFMFLDNIVYDRALVIDPWNRFRLLGNSLFLWRLSFGFIAIIVIGIIAVIAFFSLGLDYTENINIPGLILSLFIVLSSVIVIVFISMLLNNFIVPIMYRMNIKTNAAWAEFMKIFSPNFFSFILYALLLIVMYIAAVIVVLAAGFAMCCIGFILLIIPYISSVVLLPISYTFRAFSLEFLAQFGSQYALFTNERADLPEQPGLV